MVNSSNSLFCLRLEFFVCVFTNMFDWKKHICKSKLLFIYFVITWNWLTDSPPKNVTCVYIKKDLSLIQKTIWCYHVLPSNQNDLFSVFMHLYHFLHILNKYIKKCIVQFCQKHVIDTNYTACTHTGHFSAFWGSFKKVKVADSPKSFTQTFFFFFFSLFSFLFFSINYLYYMKTKSQ